MHIVTVSDHFPCDPSISQFTRWSLNNCDLPSFTRSTDAQPTRQTNPYNAQEQGQCPVYCGFKGTGNLTVGSGELSIKSFIKQDFMIQLQNNIQ